MALQDFKARAGVYANTPPPDFHSAVASVATDEEQKGFWRSMGEELVKPAAELGKDIATLLPSRKAAEDSIARLQQQTRDLDMYKDKMKPEVFARLKSQNTKLADELLTTIGERPTAKKWIGDIGGTVLTAVPLPVAKLGMVAKIGSPALRAAITGGGYMAAFGAASAMSDEKDAAGIAKEAGLGFLAGTAFGGATYLGAKGFVRLASLAPVARAYSKITANETVKLFSQFIRPVSSVLSKDFGEAGKAVTDRLMAADSNVQAAMGRIIKIGNDIGARFSTNRVGREASYQLGKTLRGKGGQTIIKPVASEFNLGVTTFRSERAQNLSVEAYDLATQGKIVEASQKIANMIDDELGPSLQSKGIKLKSTAPTIGVYEGGKEPSAAPKYFGQLTDDVRAEIALFGKKAQQDSIVLYQTKEAGVRITKASPDAVPGVKIKVPGLNESNIDDFRIKLSESTDGKFGGYITGNPATGEITILNVQQFDNMSRADFEAGLTQLRNVVKLNGGSTQTFYTKNLVFDQNNYDTYIQKSLRSDAAGAGEAASRAVSSGGLDERGRITGRVSGRAGEGQLGFGAQEALPEGKLPDDLKGLTPESYYRALFGDVAAEAQSRGTMVRVPARGGKPSQWVKFESLENYFPQQVAQLDEMRAASGIKKEGRLREWVIRRSVEEGDFRTADDAAKALDGYIEFVDRQGIGISKENGWIKWMIGSGQAETEAEAKRLMMQIFKEQSLVKLGGSLEHAKLVNNPFYNPFPDEVAPLYAMDSITRLENIEQFGVKYTGESAKLPSLTKAIDEVRTTQGRKAAEKFDKFLSIAMNRINTASDEAKLSYFLRATQVPKLAFAQIVNIGQSVINPLLKTDARSTFMGLYKAFSNKGVQRALESGATIQSVFNEMARATAAGGSFGDKFLKVTGFIWTEKFNRTVAANVGTEWATRNFEKLLKNPTKQIYRFRLQELGVNVEAALKRGALNGNDLLKAGQQIAEKTQFRSRPLDLPYWASSNSGKLFWQFKNFSYQQFRFLYENLADEVKRGNYGRAARNVMVLGTVFPMVGEVLQDVRSLVTQSKRPTDPLERYWSDLAGVGAMSMISELVDASRFDQSERFVLPPAFASITQLVDAADDPKQFMLELGKQTGVLTPVVNLGRKKRKGYESTLESLQNILK